MIEGEPAEVIAQIEQSKEIFVAGIAYYQSGDFARAQDCFEEILRQNATDKTAQIYCDRLSALIQSPPEHWNGVWSLTQK